MSERYGVREPGSIPLDERLRNIESDLESMREKLDRMLLFVLIGALGVGGSATVQLIDLFQTFIR